MFSRLRQILALPVFEEDEKTRVSQFMVRFSWMAIAVVFLLILTRFVLQTDLGVVPVLILFAVILLLFLIQYIARLGHAHIASVFVVFGLWLLMSGLAWYADGIRDLGIVAYIVVIILSSFLLDWPFALIISLLSIGSVWFFAILEKTGMRTPHWDDPISYARDLTGIIILIGVLTYQLIGGWLRTLRAARLELEVRLRAEEKLKLQAEYLSALNETALGLLNRSDIQPLLESILKRACDLMDTEHGVIDLVLPDDSALRQDVGSGTLAKYNGALTHKHEGVSGAVWRSGQPKVVQDYRSWDQSLPEFADAGFDAVMGVPLIVGESVIGVLAVSYIEQNRTFTIEQVRLMEQFAALAALAIDNARLTEQAQKEIIERREMERELRAVLNSIPDMIFEVSKDGTFLDFMASSEYQPIMSPSQFLGKKVQDLFPKTIAEQTMFALGRTLETDHVHAYEYGLPPGKEEQFFEARVSAISPESAMIMVRDISQRKWVEDEREKLINELEGKNAELERFTYTVSHDLKSPLITIKGFLGFLEQDALSGNISRLRSDITRISDAADKMQILLNELLDLSRVGRLKTVYQDIPFEELARVAVELVQGRLSAANVQVRIQENLPTIYGDRQRLIEVLQNLIDNAAKFMGDQLLPLIEVGQRETRDGMPVFFVRDNGVGIDPSHYDRIFGLFNKLDADSEGTGIGLALVKRIIEVHGGRIWIESELGTGSTFLFSLPAGSES